MDLVRDIALILHFIGLALIIGTFFVQMRADRGYFFSLVLAGSIIQGLTGLVLTGLAEMRLADDPDMSVNHAKIAVKFVIATLIFVVAVIGFLRQRKLGSGDSERTLLPLLHTAGALAVANTVIAVVWSGVVS